MERVSSHVRVGLSAFGLGVFAVRGFFAGEALGRVEGELIDDPDFESDYCMALEGDLLVDPDPPFRFVNHSCQPNCELVIIEPETDDPPAPLPELWIETLRVIEPGEQITIDYAWPAEAAIPCGCGAATCRGWIVAADEVGLLSSGQAT